MTPEEALVDVTARLTRLDVSHALVGAAFHRGQDLAAKLAALIAEPTD